MKVFLTALMFYTRIPCPSWVDHSAEYIQKSTKFFPVIGWIVGLIFCIVAFTFSFILPKEIAIILAVISTVLTTGAFHEDGFADVCDGFGGGWNKNKILEIMKDSQVGTYGALGLVINFILKYLLLIHIFHSIPLLPSMLVFISAHSLSRLMAVGIIYWGEYAREDASSKAKPIAIGIQTTDFIYAIIPGIVPFMVLILYSSTLLLLAFIPLIFMTIYLNSYFKKWIDGYTGDCLGCTQQVTELLFYISIIALWKFI